MLGSLEIVPLPTIDAALGCRRQCKILRISADGTKEHSVLWIEIPANLETEENDCDPFLMMLLMEAMREKLSIKIHGTVDQELLSNLTEFQKFWHRCRPTTFAEVPIEVAAVTHGRPVNERAICTFTGGLDSSCSVWRHSQQLRGHRNRRIDLACMLHGADIPLSNRSGFTAAFKKAAETLESVGIKLAAARTNFREISRVNWEDSHGTVIGATLSCFKPMAGIGLIASGKPYDNLRMAAWGSSPITDPLLSSSTFRVIHDGADQDRSEKAQELLGWEHALRNLRVCWAGSKVDQNCGHCHKCILTKLNFMVMGADIPPAFPPSDILNDIRSLVMPDDIDACKEWNMMLGHANAKGIEAEWVQAAREKATKEPKLSKRRKLLRSIGKLLQH